MAVATRFCGACGEAMTEHAQYCPRCGVAQAEFRAPAAPPQVPVPPVQVASNGSPPAARTDSVPWQAAVASFERLFPRRTGGAVLFSACAGAFAAILIAWIVFAILLGLVHLSGLAGPAIAASLGSPLGASASTDLLTGVGGIATGQDIPSLGAISGSIHLPLTFLILVPFGALYAGGRISARLLGPHTLKESAAAGAAIAVPFGFGLPIAINSFSPHSISVGYASCLIYGLIWAVPLGALGGYMHHGGVRAVLALPRELGRLRVSSRVSASALGAGLAFAFSVLALLGVIVLVSAGGLVAGAVVLHRWDAAVAGVVLASTLLFARPVLRAVPGEQRSPVAMGALVALFVEFVVLVSVPELRNGMIAGLLLAPTFVINLIYSVQGTSFTFEGSYDVSIFSGSHAFGSTSALSSPAGAAAALVLGLPVFLALIAAGRFAAQRGGARTRQDAVVLGASIALGWTAIMVVLREAASIEFQGGLSSFGAALKYGPNLGSTLLCGLVVGAAMGAIGGATATLGGDYALKVPVLWRVVTLPLRNLMLLIGVARGHRQLAEKDPAAVPEGHNPWTVAVDMARQGIARQQVGRYLSQYVGAEDRDLLLDEIYAVTADPELGFERPKPAPPPPVAPPPPPAPPAPPRNGDDGWSTAPAPTTAARPAPLPPPVGAMAGVGPPPEPPSRPEIYRPPVAPTVAQPAAAFCIHCGDGIAPADYFCPSCGHHQPIER